MKQFWQKMKIFMQEFPKWFGLYLALSGLITFNMFILEESFQTCMFGSWPAQNAKEWPLVKRNLATMRTIQKTLKIVNYVGGWINPIAFVSYSAYVDSETEYIDGLNALVFANAPELYHGERVTFNFQPGETEYEKDYMKMRNGSLTVLARAKTPVVTGVVNVNDGLVTVDAR